MSAAPSTFWNSTYQPVTKSQGVLPLPSFLFPSVHFAFHVLSICVFLCSFMPLCEKNSCCQFVLFSWLGCCVICVAAAPGSCCMGYISISVNEERLRGVTSASPFPPVKRPPGKEGGVLAFFPDAFSSLIPSSITLLPPLCLLPPSGSEWQKMSWSFQTSCPLAAVISCLGLVRPVMLLGVLELDLHIRCVTSQFHRNMLLGPENTCSLTLYCKHAERDGLSFHPWRFLLLDWLKPWVTWSDLIADPALSLRFRTSWGPFQAELSCDEQCSFAFSNSCSSLKQPNHV